VEFVEGVGFEILVALNCKRNLDVCQAPDSSRAYATRDDPIPLDAVEIDDRVTIVNCNDDRTG
jgi:hypothetical protein